jgi:hypothetical protein
MMPHLETLGQLANGHVVASGKALDGEHGLVLLGRDADRFRGGLAEMQEFAERIAELRQRLVLRAGDGGFGGRHAGIIHGKATPGQANPLVYIVSRYIIRAHGIPEALEAILLGRSLVNPKVAVLKSLPSAISIGMGGPFGAEGPIIMTGGAFGSLFAQLFHLSSAVCRKACATVNNFFAGRIAF